MGTAGRLSQVQGAFRIDSREDGELLEARLFFGDVADILFTDIVIEPVDSVEIGR
jgi:hypothetical protein